MIPYPEDEYVIAIGKLAYAVSYLEWAILGDLPHISGLPPQIGIEALTGKTTGGIADVIGSRAVLAQVSDPVIQNWLSEASTHLKAVSQARNGILHARPATINGRQRLNRWDPSRGETFAVEIDRINGLLEDIYARLSALNAIRLI